MEPPLLRLGILIDAPVQPDWVHSMVSEIHGSSVARVGLVLVDHPTSGRDGSTTRARHLLYRVYTRLDDLMFRSRTPALEPRDIAPLLAGASWVHLEPSPASGEEWLTSAELAALRQAKLDVLLHLGSRPLPSPAPPVARFGIWSYHQGDCLATRRGPPGFWEVMMAAPVTGAILAASTPERPAPRAIYRSYLPTDRWSVRRNRSDCSRRMSPFVLRKLRDVQQQGIQGLAEVAADRHACDAHPPHRLPGNGEMSRLALGLAARYAVATLEAAVTFRQYFLAYSLSQADDHEIYSLRDLRIVTPPADRDWADPFPVRHGRDTYVFFEERPYATGRGRISVLPIAPDSEPRPPVVVLEKDYHLSYPCVFEWRGDFYMVPESREAEQVQLYRASRFPSEWEFCGVLLDNFAASDSTLAAIDGAWWLFTSTSLGRGARVEELHLFHAARPTGPWTPHRRNPVKCDVRSARGAGQIVCWNGAYYRPAQDCSVRYGYAVSINKIVALDSDRYLEVKVGELLPNWRPGLVGTHTVNRVPGLTCLDGLWRVDRLGLKRGWRGRIPFVTRSPQPV